MCKRHGNEEETWFAEAVLDLLPALLSGALSMAASRADAEDLVADAVARAWERRADLRERDRLRGWLFRILRNCFLSERRRRHARPHEISLSGEGEEDASFSLFERLHQPFLLWWGNPEQEFLNTLLEEDLERAVNGLPEHHRVVVVLADVQGFSYAEVAEVLELPVGTVRSRLARARSRLQEALWNHAVERGLKEPEARVRGLLE